MEGTILQNTDSILPPVHAPDDAVVAALPPAQQPQTVVVAGNAITVFAETPPLHEAMLADMAAATHRIWLEVYWFSADAVGQRFAAVLRKKAQEGLDVRVHYDAVGSSDAPASFFAEMERSGVKLHCFHPLWSSLWRYRALTMLNRRNHRKLLVIDAHVGYFGGMNIVEHGRPRSGPDTPHTKRPPAASPPPPTGWRDIHIRLEGPRQIELAESFDRSWRKARGEKIPRRRHLFRRRLREIVPTKRAEEDSIRFFDSGPGLRYAAAGRVFSRLIKASRSSVTISMAYFIPLGALLRSLLRARRRGVRFRVIVPGQSDVPIVQRATSYLYARAIRRGFRIYERQHRMLHSKVMIVDDRWTVIGSANMDPRSIYFNLEFLAVIHSRPLANLMQRICRFEMQHSERITPAHIRAETPWQRFLNMLAWSFRWWL
jgi:cardiolipin synthase A/B